ncbi:MAG: YkgJ family cysteine cluster protein [Clostridiales bacterium]|nr:YkgJ family cysteine cluster protein [Clostridiales bacterium]
MERNIDMKEVSDGKLYTSNDLVKADCGGCTGCSACCRGMGTSITLDPLDIFRLCGGLHMDFTGLMVDKIELNIVDSLILPNLKMTDQSETCAFLNEEGRCSIHAFRPGICRLFPLGRFYENGSFRYFLQVHECPKENKSKVKVKKWLDTPELRKYEQFVSDWHYYLKELQKQVEADAEQIKPVSMELLNQFYVLPYDMEADFYGQFYTRLKEVRVSQTI